MSSPQTGSNPTPTILVSWPQTPEPSLAELGANGRCQSTQGSYTPAETIHHLETLSNQLQLELSQYPAEFDEDDRHRSKPGSHVPVDTTLHLKNNPPPLSVPSPPPPANRCSSRCQDSHSGLPLWPVPGHSDVLSTKSPCQPVPSLQSCDHQSFLKRQLFFPYLCWNTFPTPAAAPDNKPPPLPLTPNQQVSFLPLCNQTASQRWLAVEYTAELTQFPSHLVLGDDRIHSEYESHEVLLYFPFILLPVLEMLLVRDWCEHQSSTSGMSDSTLCK